MVADPEECDMVIFVTFHGTFYFSFSSLLKNKRLQEELTQLKDIPNSLAVFCLATYGEGDPTDNAMDFYEWIKSGDADLTGLNYAVSFSFL